MMYWHFSSTGAPVLANVHSMADPITVHNSDTGSDERLAYLPPTTAHKTLGHYKEPTGSQLRTQYRELKTKSDNITEFLWTTQLTREEAWLYYQACYIVYTTSRHIPINLFVFVEHPTRYNSTQRDIDN